MTDPLHDECARLGCIRCFWQDEDECRCCASRQDDDD